MTNPDQRYLKSLENFFSRHVEAVFFDHNAITIEFDTVAAVFLTLFFEEVEYVDERCECNVLLDRGFDFNTKVLTKRLLFDRNLFPYSDSNDIFEGLATGLDVIIRFERPLKEYLIEDEYGHCFNEDLTLDLRWSTHIKLDDKTKQSLDFWCGFIEDTIENNTRFWNIFLSYFFGERRYIEYIEELYKTFTFDEIQGALMLAELSGTDEPLRSLIEEKKAALTANKEIERLRA
jgi:hypothetical protein